LSQKCVTEAQITILNTILSLDEKDEDMETLSEDGDVTQAEDYVFNPENMNAECNEFMLVLNNYRQTQSRTAVAAGSKPKLSLSGKSGNTLENNLRSIRKENENKKARLTAVLSERKSLQEDKNYDLKVWCEKSMTAMEKSYENLLSELQTQHGKEKDSLKREKEQALAEETRATLSALDAMRKAHESEVQKEVEKFKKEFLSELRSKECIGLLQSEYQVDRDEIKREILSVASGGVGGAGGGGLTGTTVSTTSGGGVDTWPQLDDEGRVMLAAATSASSSSSSAATRLTRSPSCPRLYSNLSLATPRSPETAEEPLKSPLTGMVANRKRVFETEY